MRVVRQGLPLVVALALAGATPASAADYFVAKTGSNANACTQALPCLTVSGAVAKAFVVDGDTIHIGPGDYLEGVTSTKRLVFEGAGSGNAQGYDPAKDTFVDANNASAIGFDLNHGGTLRKLRVRGGGQLDSNAPDNAIYLHAFNAASPVSYTLDGVVAIGGSAGTSGKQGLFVSDNGGTGAAVTVTAGGDTYVTTPIAGGLGGPGWAAFVYGANVAVTFEGTTIGPPMDGLGLSVGGGGSATLKGATVLGFFGPLTGISVSGTSELHVDHSSVEATVASIIAGANSTLTVDDSLLVVKRTTAPGINVTPDVLRVGSSTSGATAAATVRNSTLIATGPGVRSAAAVTATNSGIATISLGNTALRASDTDGTPGDVDLYANGAAGTTATISADASAFSDRTQTGTGTATEPGTGTNVSGDPMFSNADPDVGNYVPAAGSPLIDRGNPSLVGAGALDLAGSARGVDGDANCSALPDIGAYEAPEMTKPDCTPVPDVTAPKVSIGPLAQRMPKTGVLTFSIRCPAAEPDPCAGTVQFQAGTVALGTATIGPLPPGTAQKVALTVPANLQKALRKKRVVRVKATAMLTDPAGNAGTSAKTLLVTTRPRVGIRAAKGTTSSALALRISCPEAEPGPCKGTVTVLLGKKVVGTAKLRKLARGFGRKVTVPLADPAKDKLASGKKVRLKVVVKVTDKLGNTGRSTKRLTVFAPKKPNRRS